MNREEAIAALRSAAPHTRLVAARSLARDASEQDAGPIGAALSVETDAWVRKALLRALAATRVHAAGDTTVNETLPEIAREVYAQAVEEVTGRLVHELRSIVGETILFASDDIGEGFEESRTRKTLTRLQRALDSIESLSRAARSPALESFDLANAVDDLTSRYNEGNGRVERAGSDPFLVVADRSILLLALDNAVRNALEATREAGLNPQNHPVVITWGATDIDYWIAVLDDGVGVKGSADRAFEIGSTTKQDHLGVGLSIALQAAATLGGFAALLPRREGGTRFEFRWPVTR